MKDLAFFRRQIGDGEEDFDETRDGGKIRTTYPKPLAKYRIQVEGYNLSIEEPYFWMLNYLRWFHSFTHIDKITDIFSASEHSAFFGASQQRLGIQQDRISQYLATIGKMVRELFQLVREMRILDERMGYYHDSYTDSVSAESAEITLKGIWVDLVEQGAKNPASVYGMAREVQFTTLPDLFFATHPKKQEDVDITVDRDRSDFNRKVREVLKRKLRSYLAWKETTFEELKNRRVFTLKYLRQHFEIIRMYMGWVKPYLKTVLRMSMDQDKLESPDLISAFETSMIEVEILARKAAKEKVTLHGEEVQVWQVIVPHFYFRTRPEMSYVQEGYQKGPLHVGRVEITLRCYAWTDKEIELYKEMRKQEDIYLMGFVDESVRAAMDALGDELMRYLQEAGEDMPALKERYGHGGSSAGGHGGNGDHGGHNGHEGHHGNGGHGGNGDYGGHGSSGHNGHGHSLMGPKTFLGAFGEMLGIYSASGKRPKKPKVDKHALEHVESIKKSSGESVKGTMWGIYHHFKKQHGMLNW
ncbi:hypothetical protein HYU14_00770 [Candidatus Woesearchaeota archaeon]|nr:hypothetical protein [Candidatus Woesearchaeota archaeon]